MIGYSRDILSICKQRRPSGATAVLWGMHRTTALLRAAHSTGRLALDAAAAPYR